LFDGWSIFRRQADALFTDSSGIREKIRFILLILSGKKLRKNPFIINELTGKKTA